MKHIPVLLQEVLQVTDPQKGEFFVDGTFGAGGYTEAILDRVGSTGRMLSLDWDTQALEARKDLENANPNLTMKHANYATIPEILAEQKLHKANGLVLDLGFSSDQLEGRGRGFSFAESSAHEPLLMTYSDSSVPVKTLLREESEDDLRSIIRKYGEERFSGRIARAIKNALRKGRIETAGELATIVRNAVPGSYERGRREAGKSIDPATRTFQAFRIYANRELENLETLLIQIPNIVAVGGRIAIVSFHSLEDRIVKLHLRSLVQEGLLELITKKPLTPAREEIIRNPRARSAKLRSGKIVKDIHI